MNRKSRNMYKFVVITIFCTALNAPVQAQATVGLLQENSAEDGYELFAPIKADTTYLIDKCGRLIHEWASPNKPGMSVYLLPDGSLLRSANVPNQYFTGNGAQGGAIEQYDWNNNLTWSYTISSDTQTQNHDIYPLANGNILVVIWEAMDSTVAIAAGRDPSLLLSTLYSAKIEELQPVGTNQATIVWQWRLWDHLIQDFDSAKNNYGVIADHPELVDINYTDGSGAQKDWIHPNAVTYNPALDQVILSAHNLSEIWILDHSTTTAEATTHSGGVHGRGGDLLYRWGNPQAYGRGTSVNEVFYTQHNPTWIPPGYPHAGSIIIFNNGMGRPGGNASSVDIFTPPVDSNGDYPVLSAGQAYGPSAEAWTYEASTPGSFYSTVMGSAQMLTDGNIVVCDATSGNFFELDSNKNVQWRYINPVNADTIVSQGTAPADNGVFRCTQYDPSYSGFTGLTLTPGRHIEVNPLLTACDSNGTTAVNDIRDPASINIYPNPASDQLNFRLSSVNVYQKFSGTVYNELGEDIETGEVVPGKIYSCNTANMKAGIYYLRVTSENQSYTSKFIITH